MDEFLLELQAKLDEAKSKGNINADVEKIQQQINKLKLQAEVDPKSISNISRQLESVIGEKITIGLTANIDTNAINQIKKASDSATNAVIQNEKKKQEAYKATAKDVIYHAGIISKLNKAETNGRFYGSSRGTGYFGTGHYFVDSAHKHELDSNSSYSNLPYTSIDISKYDNLFKAHDDETARKLHDFLENLTRYTQGRDRYSASELFSQAEELFKDKLMEIKEFESKLEELKTFMSNSSLDDRSDSVSTQFMKSLGYGGVDTRGTKYADTRYGISIYDLKEESILRANITDEMEKQGQMLEKMEDYSNGKAFDQETDKRIQSQLDAAERLKEVETEFNNIFDKTNLDNSEFELNASKDRLNEINSIITDCQNGIDNADKEAQKFAKTMNSMGRPMSDSEINDYANEMSVDFQQTIEKLSQERSELQARIPVLEENYNKEMQLANKAKEQAQQIVEQRHLEAQEASETANTIIQNEEKKQQAIQETANAYKSLTENKSVIKSGSAVTTFGGVKEAQEYFKELLKNENAVIATTEQFGSNNNLASFAVNIKRATGEVETLRYAVDTLKDDNGNITDIFYTLSGSTFNDSGAIKQLKQIEEAASNAQKVLAQFNNKSGGTLINSDEFKAVQEAIDGLGNTHSIDDLNKAMNHLETTYNDMVSMIRNSGKSFNPFIDTRNEMDIMDKKIEGISLEFEKLSNKPQEVADSIKQLSVQQEKVNSYTIGTKEWASAYGELQKQIKQVNAEITNLKKAESAKSLQPQVDKIQLSMSGKGKVDYTWQIDDQIKKLKDLGFTDEEVAQKVKVLTDAHIELQRVIDSNDFDSVESKNRAIIESDNQRTIALNQVKNAYKELKTDATQYYNLNKQTKLSNDIQNWLSKNTRASKEAKESLNAYYRELSDGRVSVDRLNYIESELKNIDTLQRGLGKLGKSLKDQMLQAKDSFVQWLSVSSAVMTVISKTKNAISELKEVNTYLTEISKANDKLSKSDLAQIGNDSFDVASKYGKTATNYLSAVQEMSRAGYENAFGMAELSVAAQGAGDMTQELANKYIIATDKAYKLGGSVEKLTEVLDGSNYITNHNAVNMTELAEGMSIVGSQASSLGVQVNQTTAVLGTMIATTQQSGSEMARAYRAILLNLQQVTDEEEGITAEGLTKYEAACKALNVSLKETKNGITSLRDPMEVIKDLAEEYSKLDANDIRRTNLLSSVGGKLRANALNAILENYDMYEKMLKEYADGTGSMAAEAEKTANSWEGSLNRLSNTWTDTVENIANSDAIIAIINDINGLLSVINNVTDKLGSWGTLGLGAGLFAGIKNVGMANYISSPSIICYLSMPTA